MNINIVCPSCLKVNRIPKKDNYTKANCGSCKKSLLSTKPVNVDASSLGIFLANSDIPIVIDFWAPWCGPCLQMAPTFEEVSVQMSLKAQFLKVNTEKEQILGSQYSIQSIPTLLIFKETKEVDRVSGALSATRLKNWIGQSL